MVTLSSVPIHLNEVSQKIVTIGHWDPFNNHFCNFYLVICLDLNFDGVV